VIACLITSTIRCLSVTGLIGATSMFILRSSARSEAKCENSRLSETAPPGRYRRSGAASAPSKWRSARHRRSGLIDRREVCAPPHPSSILHRREPPAQLRCRNTPLAKGQPAGSRCRSTPSGNADSALDAEPLYRPQSALRAIPERAADRAGSLKTVLTIVQCWIYCIMDNASWLVHHWP